MPKRYPEKFNTPDNNDESGEDDTYLCPHCKIPIKPGSRCLACGQLMPPKLTIPSNISKTTEISLKRKYGDRDPYEPATHAKQKNIQQPTEQYRTEDVKTQKAAISEDINNAIATELHGWTTSVETKNEDQRWWKRQKRGKRFSSFSKVAINNKNWENIPWKIIGIVAGATVATGLVIFGIYVGISALISSGTFENISITAPSIAAELEINAVQYGEVSDTAAAINWETSIPATGKVEYGISESLGYTADPGGEPATAHSVLLNSLQPETTYYFRVVSQPKNSDQVISGPVSSFITLPPPDIIPPVIIEVRFSDVSDINATITWKTDESTSGKIEYGTQAGKYTLSADTGTDMKNDHMLRLPDLKPAKTYYFVVKSADASGNESVSESISFTTVDYIAEGVDVGDRAVDFTLPLLDGGSVTLSQYRGQLVLINFWFLSCGGCRKELPDIEEIYKTWSGNKPLTVLTVDIRDYKTNVISFMKKNGYTFPVLLDTDDTKIWEKYGVTVAPKTFFIDTNGIVRKVQRGSFNDIDEIEEILNSL